MGKSESVNIELAREKGVSEEALDLMIKNKLEIRKASVKKNYKKKDYARIFEGYNAFEHLGPVRQYIQKKYKIKLSMLETLLFLFPKQYFTASDYNGFYKRLEYAGIKMLFKNDLAICITPRKQKKLYKLNSRAVRIVTEFYLCLSGEKKIKTNDFRSNPLVDSKDKSDIKILALIKKINKEDKPPKTF